MGKFKLYKLVDFLVMAIVALAIFVFIFVPFMSVLIEAFFNEGKFQLTLFASVFKKSLPLIRNSFQVAVLTTLLTAIASVSAAMCFFFASKKIRRVIFFILSTTIISPPFVTALTYINLFGRRGIISYHLLGISASPYGMVGIVLMQSLSHFSMGALILIGFLNSADKFEIDSARSLGANTNYVVLDIIFPSIWSAVKAFMLLTFFRSLADFGTPAIIGGTYDVIATESYFALIAHGDVRTAAVLNIIILIPALVIFFFYQKSFKNFSSISKGKSYSESPVQKKGFMFWLLSFLGAFFLIWISVQYFSIILSAFTAMRKGKLTFTFSNFTDTLPFIDGSIIRSIIYSIIATAMACLLGFLIAYYNQIRKIKLMKSVDFIAALPYIIPGTFFGLGYILAFKKPPLVLTGTTAIVVLNMLFKQMPFSVNIANATMDGISTDILNSVRDLGGKYINEFTDAIVPLSLHGMGVSFINGFTSTMTTIGSIIFLVYPGQKVLTMVMFDAIQSGKYNVGSVIALLIILICLTVNSVYFLLLKRKN